VPRRTAFNSESRSTSAYQPSAPGTDHATNTSGTFTDVNLETRRRDLSSMSGILADSSYRPLPA
jgi:hypothetical protein